MKHLREWGAVYILLALFMGSWFGQLVAMQPTLREEGTHQFWASTFENWQSEWLQLVFQAVLLLGAKHWLFKIDAKDLERIESKIDRIDRAIDRRADGAYPGVDTAPGGSHVVADE